VLVDNIMIEPKGASERFVLYGTRIDPANPESGQRVGVVFTLDFTQLHARHCTGEDAAGTETSDFERWAPSATSKGDSCLMGRRVEYTRRKRERPCYNPDTIEIAHFVANCECMERDWECDRGYKRMPIDSGTCVRDPEVPIDVSHLVPHYCRPGLHYHVSNGYRKVAGDSCTGGVQHEMSLLPCPGSAWHHSVSHGGWTVMLLLLGLCVSLAAVTYCQLSVRGGKGGSAFSRGGKGSGPQLSFLPAPVARPVAIVIGVLAGLAHLVASLAYHASQWVVDLLRCRKSAGGNISSSGGGYSSRGLGIPTGANSSSLYSGVSYGQMGKEHVETAGDDEESGHGSGGVGGKHGEDDGFGLDGDDDQDAQVLNAATIAKVVSGGGASSDAAGDLLGLGDPLTGNGDLSSGRAAGKGAPAAAVPTLRPPRSHTEGKKA
jgi:hypothetical protein